MDEGIGGHCKTTQGVYVDLFYRPTISYPIYYLLGRIGILNMEINSQLKKLIQKFRRAIET